MLKLRAQFLFLIFVSISVMAQPPQRPSGGPIQGGNMPAVGRLYGKVLDAGTKEPVAFATVTLLTMRDSLITGSLVKNNGDFSLDKLKPGRYKLRIQFIGYKTYTQPVVLAPNSMEMDLGNIRVEQETKELKEVTIQGQKQTVVMSIDKRTYNVDKDISTRGGNGLDVMKNLPGVTVDGEGNVQLRNGSPTVFIDGRPSVMTLEQIPAEEIDRIEIITNPSAKYDASTTSGIINVILKKNTKPGYNGMATAGIGTNNRYNGMINLNVKEHPFNFFVSYNINSRGNVNLGYTDRTNFTNNEISGYFRQDNTLTNLHITQFGRIGFDYNISNRNTITLSQAFNIHQMSIDDRQDFRFMDAEKAARITGSRTTEQWSFSPGFTSQIMFKHTFPKQGKELTSDITYNTSTRDFGSDFVTTNVNSSGLLLPGNPEKQFNRGSTVSDGATFQLDYTNPLTDSSKLEAGLRSNYRLNQSLLSVDMENGINAPRLRDTGLSNNFDIRDIVNAAYINYGNYFRPLGIGYQVGFRFEQTYFVGKVVDKNLTFEYIYPQGTKNLQNAIFPSIYLNRRWGLNKEAQLNFSRKINRPGWMQIMPFIMFADRQSYRIGNPNLAPEFINTAEANYNHIFNWGNLLSSAYIKVTENAITNYVYTYVDALRNDSSILVSTFINGNNAYNYGWENTMRFTMMNKKMDWTFNGHIFYTDISANSANSGVLQNRGMSWNVKAIMNYKIFWGLNLQLNGNYEAPRIIPQGTTREVYFLDISLAKDITKRMSFNFTISDVFNTKIWGAVYNTPNFTQDFTRRWESRFARITFTWRFGEIDQSLFRRKGQNQRRQDGGGDSMEF
jgi:hypothetical protein